MGVEIKELENGPEWIREIGRSCSLEDAQDIIDSMMDEDVAYDSDEIDSMKSGDSFVSTAGLRELEAAGVLEEKGGMYYIDDKSKAKYILKITGD